VARLRAGAQKAVGHSCTRRRVRPRGKLVTCAGEYVGLEEIDNGIWNVYFGRLKLGRLGEEHMRIEDAYGCFWRHKRKQNV
jgi:hypothetical protein